MGLSRTTPPTAGLLTPELGMCINLEEKELNTGKSGEERSRKTLVFSSVCPHLDPHPCWVVVSFGLMTRVFNFVQCVHVLHYAWGLLCRGCCIRSNFSGEKRLKLVRGKIFHSIGFCTARLTPIGRMGWFGIKFANPVKRFNSQSDWRRWTKVWIVMLTGKLIRYLVVLKQNA